MADLFIDMSALDRTRSDLEHASELMRNPLDSMADSASAATEIDALRSKLGEFGEEWDYGIEKLAEYSGEVATVLSEIQRTFTELDEQLASTFDAEGGQ